MAKETKRKLNPQNYYMIYYWMCKLIAVKIVDKEEGRTIREPLSGVTKEIYAIIYRFSIGKNGCCNMSYDDFVTVTGASRSTVQRALITLEQSNLISVQEYSTGELNKLGKPVVIGKLYRVNLDPLRELEKELNIEITKELTENAEKPTQWNDYTKDEFTEDTPMQKYIKEHRKR